MIMQYRSVHFREYPCTPRTINVIHKLRNNEKNITKLWTKIKDLGQGLGYRGTVLGMGTNRGIRYKLGTLLFKIYLYINIIKLNTFP